MVAFIQVIRRMLFVRKNGICQILQNGRFYSNLPEIKQVFSRPIVDGSRGEKKIRMGRMILVFLYILLGTKIYSMDMMV